MSPPPYLAHGLQIRDHESVNSENSFQNVNNLLLNAGGVVLPETEIWQICAFFEGFSGGFEEFGRYAIPYFETRHQT